jgi:hypothetical protein
MECWKFDEGIDPNCSDLSGAGRLIVFARSPQPASTANEDQSKLVCQSFIGNVVGRGGRAVKYSG